LVLVIHAQNCSHAEALSRLCNVVVMVQIIAFIYDVVSLFAHPHLYIKVIFTKCKGVLIYLN